MKNLITDNPGVGDILFLDSQNKKRYIAFGTYDKESLEKGATMVGVVYSRQGNQIGVVNKNNTTKRWSNPYAWQVTGWKLDNQPHDTTISFYSSQAAPSNPLFSYSAATLNDIVKQLNEWFKAYENESKLEYYCYVLNDSTIQIILARESYASWYQYNFKMSGLTVSYDVGQELDANSNTYALNGVGSEYKGMNWPKFYTAIRDSTSSTFNPTSPITRLGTYPLCLAAYISDNGKIARDIYGEGEDGYKKYMKEYMIEYPSQRGAFAPEFRSGHSNTYKLVGKTYQLPDGTTDIKYPAAEYCASVGYPSSGLEKGKWYLPSLYELEKIFGNVTKGLDLPLDPVNVSLAAIGGSPLGLYYVWSSCRCYAYYSWIFNGYYGCSSYYYFYGQVYCVPVVLLNIND